MFKKRGQGLSINVIIIAVVALIVLVVLIAIFTGKLGGFSTGLKEVDDVNKDCADIKAGYTLRTEAECTAAAGGTIASKDAILDPDKICCTK